MDRKEAQRKRRELRRQEKVARQDGMPQSKHLPALEAAGNFINAGNLQEARQVYEKVHAAEPDGFEVNYGLGIVHAMEGDASAAVRFLEKAIAIRPDEGELHFNLGLALSQSGEIEKATSAYQRSIEISPNDAAWLNLGTLYEENGDLAAAANSFTKAIELNPRLSIAHSNLGNVRTKAGDRESAIQSYETALEIDPGNAPAKTQLHAARARTIQDWHLPMLADAGRNNAYEKAIIQAVKRKKGAHVLDIGTGSGLLAMMAARAGAKTVTACEVNIPLANAARQVIEDNGFADQITVIGKNSTNLVVGKDMEQRADIIVSEIVDVGLIREGVLTTLSHATQALAVPGAEMIPARAKIFAVLVEAPALRQVNPLSEISGFNLSAFSVFQNPGYQKIFLAHEEHRVLSQPFSVTKFDFRTFRPGPPNHFDTLELEADITENGAA